MALYFFILGLLFGSAANAVIDRLPRKESWFSGRSKCDSCKHELSWKDLVPVISWVWLKGKCRYCRKPIPYRNVLVELFSGVSFMVIYSHSWSFSSYFLMGMLWVTMIIAVMDWETMLVSDWMVFLWMGLVFSFQLAVGQLSLTSSIAGLVVGVGLIGGMWWFSRGKAMGDGDIGIAAVMGWWLGWPSIAVGLWSGFVAGALYGVYKLAQSRKNLRAKIAFGPFLVAGSWIAFWWGDMIINKLFR